MEFSDVVLRLRDNKEEVVRIDSAVIKFSWRGLRQHKIGTVTVKRPPSADQRPIARGRAERRACSNSQPERGKTWHVENSAVIEGWAELDLARGAA